jgi:hypothetical protein
MKNHTQIYLFVICLSFLFLNLNCKKDNPITPPDDTPGRRDYTWTVDTLKANPGDLFYLFSLWGSSPTDIWAVGSGSSSAVTLWHYDGVSWIRNTSQLSSNLMCVCGFAQNDVWVSASPGGVYHYNGQSWSMTYTNSVPGTHPGFDNVWGDFPNNVYAVGAIDTINGGYNCEIAHFNGTGWTIVSTPNHRVSFNGIKRGIKESDKYFLMGTRFENIGDTCKLFEFDGSNLKEIYNNQEVATVNVISGKLYFCIGKKIFKYQNNQFVVWKDFSGTTHLGRVWGRSELDFFTVASDGLTHYNGTDLITLYPTGLFINDVFVFINDIFILCNNRIIIHGTLK